MSLRLSSGVAWHLPGRALIPTVIGLGLGVAVAALPLSVAALSLAILVLAAMAFLEPSNGIVILLVVAPLKALLETEAPLPLPLDVGQLALVFVVGVWALTRLIQRQPLTLPTSIVQVLLLPFIFVAFLSLPGAPSVNAGLAEVLKWIEIVFLIGFCLALYHHSRAYWLVFALVLAAAVQAVVGLYEFFGGSGAEHLWILENRHFRAFGTFGQPNPFGAFMGISLPLAATTAWGYGARFWRAGGGRRDWRSFLRRVMSSDALVASFYATMTVLIGAGLVASWSRGAWMGFAGSALAMLAFAPRSLARGLALAVAAVGLILTMWGSGLVPDSLSARLSGFLEELTTIEDARGLDITDSNYAVTERIAHWQAAVMMAQDRPWLGVGFGNYEAAYADYALLNWPQALGHAHNYYLNLLAEVGVAGLVAYLVAWGAILALTIRLCRRIQGLERAWAVGLLGTWSYLAIHSAVDKLYVNNLFLHVGCALGMLALLHREQTD